MSRVYGIDYINEEQEKLYTIFKERVKICLEHERSTV